MHIIVKSFKDRATQAELFRVILHTPAGDLSFRPTSSIADAMSKASQFGRQLGLETYDFDGKTLLISRAA